jgi:hypothetical protein
MGAETSKKIKGSPKKPGLRKNSKDNKPPFMTILTVDDIDLIITAVSNTSEEIFQQSKAKQETMFDRIKADLKGVQQALYSSHIVSTASLSAGDIEVGDEPTQLRRLADSTEAHLRRV